MTSRKVDIAIVLETKLRNEDKLDIQHYKIERQDRPDRRTTGYGRGGGVIILIKNGIPYKRLPNLRTTIEHVAITLKNNVTIAGAYAPPWLNMTENDLTPFFTITSRCLLLGDLNAKHTLWNNHINNRAGLLLHQYIHDNDHLQLLYTDEPTHYPLDNNNIPSYIDIGINKGLRGLSDLQTETALNSDHLPVWVVWNESRETTQQTVYDYTNFNWPLYRQRLNEATIIPRDINSIEALETEVECFTRNVCRTRNALARKVVNTPKEDRLPNEILDLIRTKNRIRKRWQNTRRDEDKRRMTELTNQIRTDIKTYKNKCWTEKLTKLNVRDNSLWKITKNLRKTNEKVPTITHNGRDFFTNKDKAEVIAEHFADVHKETPDMTDEQRNITNRVASFVERKYPIPPRTFTSLKTTPGEVKKFLQNLPNNKAPGPDTITYKLLKNLPRKTIVQLTHIVNGIILHQHFPTQWKSTIIVPIPKPGKNATNRESYRPISLVNSVAKLVEKILLERINREVEKFSIIPPEQFGFRPNHNTTMLAAKIACEAYKNFNKEMNTAMLLLDMEKAFDSVWHAGLIYKLFAIHKLPLHLVSLIHSYIQNRTFQVRVEDVLSTPKNLYAGVPQGTVLSPQLYILYTADLPKHPMTNLALYADDTTIYSHSYYAQVAKIRINHHMRILLPFYDKWKLKINAQKTELIVFTKKNSNYNITPLFIKNTPIAPKKQVKYLGVVFDRRLTFYSNISYLIQKHFAASQKLYPLMNPNSPLSPANKLLIFKTILRPILTYAAPVWNIVPDRQRRRLQVQQNKSLRAITSSRIYTRITDLHDMTGVEYISQFIDNMSEKFYTSQIQGSELTRNLTDIRFNPNQRQTHGPIYKRLPIYYRNLQPP